MATMRMSEKEAAERGWIKPPADTEAKADPDTAGKRLYQETLARHRRGAETDQWFMTALLFIAGWLFGFVCALVFAGR